MFYRQIIALLPSAEMVKKQGNECGTRRIYVPPHSTSSALVHGLNVWA